MGKRGSKKSLDPDCAITGEKKKKWRAVEKITGALDVHEEGVGTLHEPLKLVPPGLRRGGRVQEILDKLQIGRRKFEN